MKHVKVVFLLMLFATVAWGQVTEQRVQQMVDSTINAILLQRGLNVSAAKGQGLMVSTVDSGMIIGYDAPTKDWVLQQIQSGTPNVPVVTSPSVLEIEKDSTMTRVPSMTMNIKNSGVLVVGMCTTYNGVVTSITQSGKPLALLNTSMIAIHGYTYGLVNATAGPLVINFASPSHASVIAVVLKNASELGQSVAVANRGTTPIATFNATDYTLNFLAVDQSSPAFSGNMLAKITRQPDGENLGLALGQITLGTAANYVQMSTVVK